jgi:hypothetical protein
MMKFNAYQFKKIYIDQQIFVNDEIEIKVGYLNINGLLDGGHAEYLNEDKNLKHLQLLAISETKLDVSVATSKIEKILSNWSIIRREDAKDESKHMGLLLLAPKASNVTTILKSLRYQKALRIDKLQIQGLIVRFTNHINIGFIYCRTTPTDAEVRATRETFKECQVLMGDFNLSPKKEAEQEKLKLLCNNDKCMALKEITRRASINQPDHILVDRVLERICFATSFFNFISDHKSIVVRIGETNNTFTPEVIQKINFDSESHLKAKRHSEFPDEIPSKKLKRRINKDVQSVFRRTIENPDMSSCWLNAFS